MATLGLQPPVVRNARRSARLRALALACALVLGCGSDDASRASRADPEAASPRQGAGSAAAVSGAPAGLPGSQTPELPETAEKPAPADAEVERDDPLAPGPAARVAGSRGLDVQSTVRFESDPEHRPHGLRSTHGFPERARIQLSLPAPPPVNSVLTPAPRYLEYRFGGRGWLVSEGQAKSTALDGADLADLIRRIELRAALFLWPAGYAWEPDASEPRTRQASLSRGAGTLSVELDAEGQPLRFSAFRADGNPAESYAVEAWSSAPRPRPERVTLFVGGQRIWTETVEKIQTRAYHQDVFFQPVDRFEDDE